MQLSENMKRYIPDYKANCAAYLMWSYREKANNSKSSVKVFFHASAVSG